MEEQIKLILFEQIYHKLGLENIEKSLIDKNIKAKNIQNPDNIPLISKYFFLLNDINLEKLSDEEKQQLSLYINEVNAGKLENKDSLYDLLWQKRFELLIPETEEKYLIYGDFNFQNIAPSDAFVIAFHYLEFQDDYDENVANYTADIVNHIQENLGPKNDMKVAVLRYNEKLISRHL